MKIVSLCLATVAAASLSTQVIAKKLEPVWEVEGFKMPESVVYDETRKQYYVSNVNQAPMEQDNNGSIGIIKENGKNPIVEWITGFSSPKGLGLKGDTLYVADVKELIVIDVAKGKIKKRFSAPDTMILNGIAISDENVFVTDWMGNAIYTVEEDGIKLWLKSADLDMPNGLYVQGDYLYVGAWGNDVQPDFSTKSSGNLKRVSIKTKKIETLTDGEPWMNLDGLHAINDDRLIASDFVAGKIHEFNSQGDINKTFEVGKTAADFTYVKDKNIIVVPYLMANKVVAFKYQ